MLVRLNKYLSQAGAASRREADRLITDGRIRVNGRVEDQLGAKIDDAEDRVELDGRPVRKDERVVHVLMNKPVGAVVSLRDPFGRTTVRDLLVGLKARVFPVGRLDTDSSGALLLTNDGDLAFRLAHPRFEVPKVYLAKVEGVPSDENIEKLRKGIFLEGKRTAPAKASLMSRSGPNGLVRITIHEGRKREVRKMFEALGHPVKDLKRVEFAGLTLEGLKPGAWRLLDAGEVRRLRKRAGLG
jgi:23S rRNA pseudouridine2605 synthase